MASDGELSATESEKQRRRRVLYLTLLLMIGLPIYIIVAASLVAALNPPIEGGPPGARTLHWTIELLIYLGLGLVWAFPLKRMVMGVGKKAD